MCGLVGAFRAENAPFNQKVREFMEKGIYVSAMRGMEGTGVGLVGKDWDVGHVKSHVDAASFVQTDQFEWAKREMWDSRVILGHTRHSTIANSIAAKNSHPFQWRSTKNEVLLTHNGHVSNASLLSGKGFNHAVDSAHVAYALLNDKDTKILEQLMGFYVCVWFDKGERALKMARNNTRDLYYVYNKAKTQIYYASEAEILAFVCERQGIDADLTEFHEIEPGELLIWSLEAKTLADPKRIKYTEKKSQPHQAATTYHAGQNGGANQFPRQTNTDIGTTGGTEWPRNFTSLGLIDPQGPAKQHDTIYVDVKDFDTFRPYQHDNAPLNTRDPSFSWGTLYGTRTRDKGSLVKIDGIQKYYLDEVLVHIQDHIPCKVNSAELIKAEDGEDLEMKDWYWSYNVSVDRGKAQATKYNRDKLKASKAGHNPGIRSEVQEQNPFLGEQMAEALAKVGDDIERKLVGTGTALTVVSPERWAKMVPGPGPNNQVTLKIWAEMAEMGCFLCNGVITESDLGKVAFYAFNLPPEDHDPKDIDHQMICVTCRRDLDMERRTGEDPTKPFIFNETPIVGKEARIN